MVETLDSFDNVNSVEDREAALNDATQKRTSCKCGLKEGQMKQTVN